MTTLYESEFCEIKWVEDGSILYFNWKGYVTSDGLRIVANKILELVKEKKATRYLSDNTNVPVYSKEDQDWINTVWFPQVIQAGIKRLAMIEPTKVIQKGVLGRITQNNNSDALQTAEFNTYDEAAKWLKS